MRIIIKQDSLIHLFLRFVEKGTVLFSRNWKNGQVSSLFVAGYLRAPTENFSSPLRKAESEACPHFPLTLKNCSITIIIYFIYVKGEKMDEEKKRKGFQRGLIFFVFILMLSVLALAWCIFTAVNEYQAIYEELMEIKINMKDIKGSSEIVANEVLSNETIANTTTTDTVAAEETTTPTQTTENKYAIVEKLALEKAINYQLFMGDGNTNYITPKKATINKIEIVDEKYADIMVENNVSGNYPFQKTDLESGDFEILGSVTFTLEFDQDVNDGYFAGYGPQYKHKNFAVHSTGFRVKKENGEYKIEFENG